MNAGRGNVAGTKVQEANLGMSQPDHQRRWKPAGPTTWIPYLLRMKRTKKADRVVRGL